MYENGIGVNRNFDEALALYQLSAAQRDERGIEGVARLFRQAAVIKGRAALNAFDEKMKIADPNYAAKRAILVSALKPVIARIEPLQWAATVEEAYRNLPDSSYARPTETPSPLPPPEEKVRMGMLGKLFHKFRKGK